MKTIIRDINFYIEEAKTRSHVKSDRKLGEMLGLAPNAPNAWRKRNVFPSDDAMIRLAELARINPEEALLDLNYWRAPASAQKTYAAILQKIGHSTAAVLAVAIFGFCITVNKADASPIENVSIEKSDSIYYGKKDIFQKLKTMTRNLFLRLNQLFLIKTCKAFA